MVTLVQIMAWHRRQAIIWTNDGMVYWCIHASPGLSVFKVSTIGYSCCFIRDIQKPYSQLDIHVAAWQISKSPIYNWTYVFLHDRYSKVLFTAVHLCSFMVDIQKFHLQLDIYGKYPKVLFTIWHSCCFIADIQHVLWYWWTVVYGDVCFLSSLAEQSTLAPTHSGGNQHCHNSTTPEYDTTVYPHYQRINRACFLSIAEQGIICSIFSLSLSPCSAIKRKPGPISRTVFPS